MMDELSAYFEGTRLSPWSWWCSERSSHEDEVPVQKRSSWKESFPPQELLDTEDGERIAAWFSQHLPAMRLGDKTLTAREKQLQAMSLRDYISARQQCEVTCEEYAKALLKRMMHYSYMNAFMYLDNMPHQTEYILEQARDLDKKAREEGISAIAPLYGLPVPVKGTMATTDFPSSAGHGLLHDCYAKMDAGMVTLLRSKHAVIMGKTNVPDFAASFTTANYSNGCTLNPYDHGLLPGGSSGGAASAVATYIAPLALSEDTGGSTRMPALQNQCFGYDPSRNHYPNDGNAAITFTNDQVGLLARSLEDILPMDAALLGLEAEHAAARAGAPALRDIRVGLPQWPFVEFFVPEGCHSSFGQPHMRISDAVAAKYEAVKGSLGSAGVGLVEGEWPTTYSSQLGREINSLAEIMYGRIVNGKPCDTGLLTSTHSFSGQVAQWVSIYLGAEVSLSDLISDIRDFGDHQPGHFLEGSGKMDESQFRYVMAIQPEVVRIYNSYFNTHNVDVILLPGLMCDAITWKDIASGACPVRVFEDGEWIIKEIPSMMPVSVSMFTLKNIPIPKIMVPTGLDESGRPTGVQLWGRAPPVEQLYDDEYAKTFDLAFLHTAKVLIDSLQNKPSLKRVDAPVAAELRLGMPRSESAPLGGA
eukprot:CAMPEP_0197635366 /NCGR_PEP_ID=MMETSP1338-20131121/11200_1 /TAXON_ID=43686 ORGANISM="Pelagodinium beii, Strain RCC1491" /NCGR_SAMPLE_ID=MMETSP1338 /ASSEMBLY_ACC=CAM_ASM_000754 /LENGTH=644 /DNA_ID=CAMNT_0043207397 /DNA_START=11 /DNA_END=1945 /DNA_ORIENTATION=-